jgi:hypothetical protein
MQQSHVIDIFGVFAGAAVRLPHAYRFVAVTPGLSAIDGREFADLEAVRRAVRQRLAAPRPPITTAQPQETRL